MDAYHVLMVHFPVALWMTSALAILLRVFSDGPLARAVDSALVALLSISLLSGIVAFSIGLMVWPLETISASALARNHVLLASWTVSHWAIILFVRWRRGAAVWQGVTRWIMAVLALLGSAMLAITATLGGHLSGIYSEVSTLLSLVGWEVYKTHYVPDAGLAAFGIIVILLLTLAVWSRSKLR